MALTSGGNCSETATLEPFRLNPAYLTSSLCLKKEDLAAIGHAIILPSGALLTLPIL